MKKQSGFTLIELAIVLVIIGLLLGGVLKGQELINSAKVKNMVSDFKNVQVYIYGYQDKFRSLPGDDRNVGDHVGGVCANATAGDPTSSPCYASAGPLNNGVINGDWYSSDNTQEAFRFWQHVRAANLAPGPTGVADSNYQQRNADNGLVGVQSVSTFTTITGWTGGSFVICSDAVLGKFAKQIDTTLDDGETSTGSVRAILHNPTTAISAVTGAATATSAIGDSNQYVVCMQF